MESTNRDLDVRGATARALAAAAEALAAPLGEVHPRVSAALAGLVPHRASAELSTHCAHSPFKTHGEPGLADRIAGAELAALTDTVRAGHPWQGWARIAGAEHPVLAVASDATPRGALLVLVRPDARSASRPLARPFTRPLPVGREGDEVGVADLATVQAFWDLVTTHMDRLAREAVPGPLAVSRAVSGERARVIAELGEAHTAALTGLLGILRSHRLDDSAARTRATDLAVSALAEARAEAEWDRTVAMEPADQAFARLAEALRTLLRHSQVQLELGAPADDRPLAADVVHAARAVVRAVVLAVLDQDPLHRVHVGWQVDADAGELRATVRDDGPGVLSRDALGAHRVGERLTALGGRLDVDAVPGWGTKITAVFPLDTPEAAPADPLSSLGARELEVLGHLAQGHRNRVIAQALHISESTVKFHVANILAKLSVTSRGEAAALAHTLRAA